MVIRYCWILGFTVIRELCAFSGSFSLGGLHSQTDSRMLARGDPNSYDCAVLRVGNLKEERAPPPTPSSSQSPRDDSHWFTLVHVTCPAIQSLMQGGGTSLMKQT